LLSLLTLINFSEGEEWAGHIVRMTDDGTVKKIFLRKPEGIRKAERSKLKWLGCWE
jgi:hypothetical protein